MDLHTIKIQNVRVWGKNKIQIYVFTRSSLQYKDANTRQRKARITTLISDKADFTARKLIKDKEEALHNDKKKINLPRQNNP